GNVDARQRAPGRRVDQRARRLRPARALPAELLDQREIAALIRERFLVAETRFAEDVDRERLLRVAGRSRRPHGVIRRVARDEPAREVTHRTAKHGGDDFLAEPAGARETE